MFIFGTQKKMFQSLYNWKFWVVAAIIVIFLIWLFFGTWGWRNQNVNNVKDKSKKIRRTDKKYPPKCGCQDAERGQAGYEEYDDGETEKYQSGQVKYEVPRNGYDFIYQNHTHFPPAQQPLPVHVAEPRHFKAPEPRPGPHHGLTSSREAIAPYHSSYVGAPYVPPLPPHILNPPVDSHKSNDSKGERECRAAAKRVYGVDFVKMKFDWLRNPETGRQLELDLYNDELKLGIEYQGKFHYEYNPHFHKGNPENFEKAKKRDEVKIDLCDQHGVYVITVPYNCPDNKIEDYIRYWDPTAYALRLSRKAMLEDSTDSLDDLF